MAVQIPDPGTGNGQTGDNEYVFRKKVRDNFSDQSNAASRLVGVSKNNLVAVGDWGLGNGGYLGNPPQFIDSSNLFDLYTQFTGCQFFRGHAFTDIFGMGNNGWACGISAGISGQNYSIVLGYASQNNSLNMSTCKDNVYTHHKLYSDKNTTTDGNGYIKPSSPVLRVFNDHIEGNDDGDAMAAMYTKNGMGNYTISGTTGLHKDGWYITIPNDINGNPHVAVTLDDTDGVITLKTYVRIFDMSTFKFVPDLNQPLDIPDGRWIDLRFNDLSIDDVPLPDEV